DVARKGALADQYVRHLWRLFRRVATSDSRHRDDVWDPEIVQPSFALLEEKDELIARTVVITHPDRALVPHKGLPAPETSLFCFRVGDEHRFSVTQEVEVRVTPEDAVDFAKEFTEARVRENLEPVVARRLAVFQPSRRADGPMLLERFICRIGDDEIDGLWRLGLEPADGVMRESFEWLGK